MNEDPQGALGKVIAKAWSDADFKQRLLADPKVALAEMGLVAPERLADMTVTVVENTDDNVHLVLPGPCHGPQGGVGGYMSDLVEGWVVKE